MLIHFLPRLLLYPNFPHSIISFPPYIPSKTPNVTLISLYHQRQVLAPYTDPNAERYVLGLSHPQAE